MLTQANTEGNNSITSYTTDKCSESGCILILFFISKEMYIDCKADSPKHSATVRRD